MLQAHDILAKAPVIPVLSIDHVDDAVPLARALVRGGIPVLEVTLRTAAGLPSILAIREQVPEAIVGAGTVLLPSDYYASIEVGSQFVVTPGLTDGLLKATQNQILPFIPGVATVSEIMRAVDHGYDCLKFFPAGPSGGPAALKAFAGPLPSVRFCPTGGVNPDNMTEYLSLSNVLTVGGSWLTPPALVERGAWEEIEMLAREASHRASACSSS